MHALLLLALYYLLAFGCAAYAWSQGDRGERLGAIWFALNMLGTLLASAAGFRSPTIHLIEDGIFAVGVLPLAIIYVSYWIGLVTFAAAALFTLEALYLINDLPIDNTYSRINNSLWLAVLLIFLISGICNQMRRRKSAFAPKAPLASAAFG